ncbi:YTH domain-containing protein 1-like isoform X2 [Watersipora subatra]|uniref:YTH domain-containing protein 1-like isoform X2 n=1 Tax=Watersipora subatra TaxID=2589382 RepID=UPI00355B6B82
MKGNEKAAKRTQSNSSKKVPAAKKTKMAVTKSRLKIASKEKPTAKLGKDVDSFSEQELLGEASNSEERVATESSSPGKLSIEEKRRAIQAERLRKQREMEALLEEEEALMRAEEQEMQESEQVEESPLEAELLNQSADSSYDTRSEIEGSHDGDRGKGEACDEFESMDDIATGEAEADQSDDEFRDMEPSMADGLLDSHEPPSELGLAGLEEEEEDEDEFDETERKKHAISPVTWDVDVHAADENISDDSPIPSDDSNSETEQDNEDDQSERRGKSERSETGAKKVLTVPVSNHIKTGRASPTQSRDRSPENGGDRRAPAVKPEMGASEAMRPRVNKYLYREAKYFMVKSNNHENVRLAKAKGVWSTPPQNEIRFNKAVEENTTVILVFSVKESGAFQGFARINGVSQKDGPKIAWVLPPGISAKALSGVFKLDWISRTDLNFPATAHLRNPWNQNKQVKIARDGQEIEPHVGESLCKLFSLDGSSDYERVISRVKRKREDLLAKGPLPVTKAPYRPASSVSREAHSDYRPHNRGYGHTSRGNYRGGRSAPYRPAPSSYQSSRQSMSLPVHHNYNTSTQSQYFTSNSRNSYNDYRNRSSYPHAHGPYPAPVPSYHSAPPVSQDIFVKGSYEQYVDQMRRAGNLVPDMGNTMSMYDVYSASYHAGSRDAPPPPPIPSYSTSRDRDRDRGRPSNDRYDRAVEDFLRRTTTSRSSRDPRHKDSRDARDSRDSRDLRDSRDYHRNRSRSRERDRHRDRR